MAPQKPTLIIVPGLGDHTRRYRPLVFLWRILGYDVHIFSFKWADEAEDFQDSLRRLLEYLEIFKGKINIIGVSAGGSAAVNAIYLKPQKVNKVVTVAAAFQYVTSLKNQKLRDSIENLHTIYNSNNHNKILSFYGIYDQKVPLTSTMHLQTRRRVVPIIGHGIIIFIILTFYAIQIRKFLESNQ